VGGREGEKGRKGCILEARDGVHLEPLKPTNLTSKSVRHCLFPAHKSQNGDKRWPVRRCPIKSKSDVDPTLAQPSTAAEVQFVPTPGGSPRPQDTHTYLRTLAQTPRRSSHRPQDVHTNPNIPIHPTLDSALPPCPACPWHSLCPLPLLFFSGFWLVFHNLNEVAIWGKNKVPPSPPAPRKCHEAGVRQASAIPGSLFSPVTQPLSHHKAARSPGKRWTMRTCGTRGQT
jgi:hypothetical protein